MIHPNYEDGSIINIVSSITNAFGNPSTTHKPLPLIKSSFLSKKKNVILIVLDGLGYNFITKQENTFIKDNLIGKCTSVFPSTTATAITSFLTGMSPTQHAITGWFVYLKELGTISAILPFKPRYGGEVFSKSDIYAKDIFKRSTIFENMNRKAYMLSNDYIINSDYTTFYSKGSTAVAYKRENIDNFFANLMTLVNDVPEEKFVYAYWPTFDTLAHKNGINSTKCRDHYKKLSRSLENFIYAIRSTDTAVIITADHGLVDSTQDDLIDLEQHPQLKQTLVMPLSGDPRASYCYVKQGMADLFENYVRDHLSDKCDMFKSKDFVQDHMYGFDEPDPKLLDRIGDYILIPKINYVIKDSILGENSKHYIGHHGGVSEDEMFIPVILIEP